MKSHPFAFTVLFSVIFLLASCEQPGSSPVDAKQYFKAEFGDEASAEFRDLKCNTHKWRVWITFECNEVAFDRLLKGRDYSPIDPLFISSFLGAYQQPDWWPQKWVEQTRFFFSESPSESGPSVMRRYCLISMGNGTVYYVRDED